MKKFAIVTAVVLFALLAYAGAVLAHDNGACPMAVKGAKVEVKNTDKGVTIVITADDADAVKEIQARAEKIGKDGCGCMKGEKKGEGHKCPHAKDKDKEAACGGDQESKCPHAK